MGKLDGKVAIVTGAARGLGRAYARRLAGLGAKIAVADLNLKSFEEFEAEAQAMTADSTVAEIRGRRRQCDRHRGRCLRRDGRRCHGSAGVRGMGARRCAGRQRRWRTRAAGRHQGEHARSGAAASGHQHEPVRHGVLLQRRCADHEAAALGQDRHGEFGGRTVAFVGRRLRALRRRQGGDRALHAVPGTGPRAVRHHRELHRTGHHHHRAHRGDGDARQCGCQSRPDGARRTAPARHGGGLRQGGGVPGHRSVRLRDRRGDPDRWRVAAVINSI